MKSELKNIILSGYPNNKQTQNLINALELNDVLVKILFASDDSGFIKKDNLITIFHSNLNNADKFINIKSMDPKAIAFLAPNYSIILRAMSRWDESVLNLDDKIFLIDTLFIHFCDLIKKHNIKTILFGTGSPHHFYNLVLTYSSKYLNVGNVFPITNWITNRVRYVLNDNNNTIPVLGIGRDNGKMNDYLTNLIQINKLISFDSLRIYNDKSTKNYLLFLIKHLFFKILGRLKHIITKQKDLYINDSGSVFYIVLTFVRKSLFSQYFKVVFKRKYNKNISKTNPKNSIIFYAQNQPEATSHPDGGFYPDKRYWYYFFKKLGKKIYYKEHNANFVHHQDGWIIDTYHHRSFSYLDFFLKRNVELLPVDYSTRKLLENNNNIFTFSGTVILESIINGKAAYFCGKSWHGDFPKTEIVYSEGEATLKKAVPLSKEELLNHFDIQDSYSFPNFEGFSTFIKEEIDFEKYYEYLTKIIKQSIILTKKNEDN